MRWPLILLAALLVVGCREENADGPPLVRGLKTHLVERTEQSTNRRFPAVLEAAELTSVSFEVGGKLGHLDLRVGQRLQQGEVIAALDPTSLELQVETSQAAVAQAQAASENATATHERLAELFKRGATTRVSVDDALAQADGAAASLAQAIKSLEVAQENLTKTELRAPFEAIVNSVDLQSFSTVAVGTPVATLYPADNFEVSLSVNFDIVNRLVIGKPAQIRLADRPDIQLSAVVSEIGSRADAVSSFPIVLRLTETSPLLKAGMAVEASMRFPLPTADGFTIPLSAVIMDGQSTDQHQPGGPNQLSLYVYDPDTQTVHRRDVMVGGISENEIVVIEGLGEGERVASAGVSFLRDGQTVKLLTDAE